MTTKVSHAHAHTELLTAFLNAGLTRDQTVRVIKALDHYMAAGFGHVGEEQKAEADLAKAQEKAEAKADKEHASHAAKHG